MKPSRLARQAPDRVAALAQYRRRAGFYDLELALLEPLRRRAIALLALRPGEVVLDVGCGTGLSLALLSQAIGANGRIVGIEQSPEMIELARQRVVQRQLPGVTLLNSPVEIAAIPVKADSALFHFTHDILRQAAAIAKVTAHLKLGARVVASGLKWAPPLPVSPSPSDIFATGLKHRVVCQSRCRIKRTPTPSAHALQRPTACRSSGRCEHRAPGNVDHGQAPRPAAQRGEVAETVGGIGNKAQQCAGHHSTRRRYVCWRCKACGPGRGCNREKARHRSGSAGRRRHQLPDWVDLPSGARRPRGSGTSR